VSFAAQLVGTLLGIVIALAGGVIVYGVLQWRMGLRLDDTQEFIGADISIHGVSSTPGLEQI